MNETAHVFEVRGERALAVLSAPPASSAGDTALVVIVGGPQYRAGSHRQFVRLARAAADAGVPALRFDTRGMGDSEGAQRGFEEIADDIAGAIDALQAARPEVRRIGLWGLCGGASAALLYCLTRDDPRVAGLALINPWVRSEVTQARTQVKHYYLQRLREREFWAKLLRGGVAARALPDLLRALWRAVMARRGGAPGGEGGPGGEGAAAGPLDQRMLQGWRRFDRGPTLLVLSGQDYTAKEFLETVQLDDAWQARLAAPDVTRLDLPDADHTFSAPDAHDAVERATLGWLAALGRVR